MNGYRTRRWRPRRTFEAPVRGQIRSPRSAGVRRRNRPVGFALYFTTFSTFVGGAGIYLEDIYCRAGVPRKRDRGSAAHSDCPYRCASENYGRMEWSVLTWNQPAIDFYDRRGADHGGLEGVPARREPRSTASRGG